MPAEIEYTLKGDRWEWSGRAMDDPGSADAFAKLIGRMWEKVRTKISAAPIAFRYFAPGIIEVIVPGEKIYKLFNVKDEGGGGTATEYGVYIMSPDVAPPTTEKPAVKFVEGVMPIEVVRTKPVEALPIRHGKEPKPRPGQKFTGPDLLHALERLMDTVYESHRGKTVDEKVAFHGNVHFTPDGRDLLLVTTDGIVLTLVRIPGGMNNVRGLAKGDTALVPITAFPGKIWLALKNARKVELDFAAMGNTYEYAYDPPHRQTAKAANARIYTDDQFHDLPVIDKDPVNWRMIMPNRSEWSIQADADALRGACKDFEKVWAALAKKQKKKQTGGLVGDIANPALRMLIEGEGGEWSGWIQMDLDPHFVADKQKTWSCRIRTDAPLAQNRAVRFYINPVQLRRVIEHASGMVTLEGVDTGLRGADDRTYLNNAIQVSEWPGPVIKLVMPLMPPR